MKRIPKDKIMLEASLVVREIARKLGRDASLVIYATIRRERY